MRIPLRCSLTGLAFLTVACGGGGSSHGDTSDTRMTAAQAGATASVVLGVESAGQASASTLPIVVSGSGTGSFGLVMPTLPACTTVTTTGPDSGGFTHQTWTFTNCTEGDETLNGSIDLVFKTGDYQITFNHLVRSEDGGEETTTLDGTKHVVIDTTAKTGTITVTNFTVSHTEQDEPDENRTFVYNAGWHSDWSVTGTYKLWGSFSLTTNGEPTRSGQVQQADALTWTLGCCSPTAGVLTLTRGSHVAVLTFGPTCGNVSVIVDGAPPVLRHLRRCH